MSPDQPPFRCPNVCTLFVIRENLVSCRCSQHSYYTLNISILGGETLATRWIYSCQVIHAFWGGQRQGVDVLFPGFALHRNVIQSTNFWKSAVFRQLLHRDHMQSTNLRKLWWKPWLWAQWPFAPTHLGVNAKKSRTSGELCVCVLFEMTGCKSDVWRIRCVANQKPQDTLQFDWTLLNTCKPVPWKNTRFDGAQGICHVLLKRTCLVAQVCRGCIWLGVNLRKPIQWWITKIAGRWVSQIKVTMMTKVWARIRDTVNHDGEKTEHPCTWFLLCF